MQIKTNMTFATIVIFSSSRRNKEHSESKINWGEYVDYIHICIITIIMAM